MKQNPILHLKNNKLHVKVDLTRGGAISYLSPSTRNLVNTHDEGRYIQQSYYAGNNLDRSSEGQNPRWSPWPWNPIQVGDCHANRARIVEAHVEDDTIYVKCVPMQWDMNNFPAEATLEQWTTLEGNILKVRNKITCHRTDNLYGEGFFRNQELPAVYLISSLNKLYSYFGDAPFSNDDMDTPSVVNLSSGFWGRYKDVTENWMAFTDNKDWGVGVYTPGSIEHLAGMTGTGNGEEKSGSTCYLSPLTTAALKKNSIFEYDYYLIIGHISNIRSMVYELRKEPNLNWEFKTGDDGWNLRPNNCTLGSNGNLVMNVTGSDPHVYNTTFPQFFTKNITHLQLRVKNETDGDAGSLMIWPSTGGTFKLRYPLTPNNNSFEDISINFSNVSEWTDVDFVRNVRINPNNGEKGTITFDFIRFFVPLGSIKLSGPASVTMGSTGQMSVHFFPENATDNAVLFKVDDSSIATIDANGVLVPVTIGMVEVIVTSVKYPAISDTVIVQITVETDT